jgi:hypothetical protein
MFGSRLIGTALLIGGGALAIGVVIAAPTILRTGRPLIRQGLKRGLEVYARARAAAAEFVEDVEDLVAEVQSELTHDRSGVPSATESPREASRR